jgi:putative ABC transport system ATP-binding protein
MLLLEGVKKAFGLPDGSLLPVLAIDRFELAAAEQAVLVGRSGCGKTTLLHIIAGISRPDEGRVVINGQDIARMSEPARDRFRANHIGYVFQTFNLLAGFTALENVLLGMAFSSGKGDAQRARSLLERVGLGRRLHHKPGMLSVGEQQRVAVARALANRPRLLLADEPTANVDVRHQQEIIDAIRGTCQEQQVALLLVTHAPEVAGQFDRVEQLEQLNQVVAAT